MPSNPPKAVAFYPVKSAMAFLSRCNIFNMLPFSFLLLMLIAFAFPSHAEIPGDLAEKIKRINARGVHDSLVVSDRDELRSVVSQENGMFKPFKGLPSVDISARRFHVGDIGERRTIVVMCGPGMANAAQTTQLLVTLFRVRAVVHYGRAGLANSNKGNIGDVVIPRQFAHTGIFYWEKYGGDDSSYDRDIANLTFSEYNVGDKKVGNELQSVYFQPEVIYSAEGKPEEGKPKFWMKVDDRLYATAQKLESVKLDKCVREKKSSACLQEQPKIRRVERASSANIYVNNAAYRDFLHTQLDVTSIDTQSAAIAMVCESEKRPFLAMRSITNYAGGSFEGNDVTVIKDLWPEHARSSITELFNGLPSHDSDIRSVTGRKIW